VVFEINIQHFLKVGIGYKSIEIGIHNFIDLEIAKPYNLMILFKARENQRFSSKKFIQIGRYVKLIS